MSFRDEWPVRIRVYVPTSHTGYAVFSSFIRNPSGERSAHTHFIVTTMPNRETLIPIRITYSPESWYHMEATARLSGYNLASRSPENVLVYYTEEAVMLD